MATDGYFDKMKSVGIKALKDRLSEYVRLAAAGETILVTDRDQVVAELVPPRENRSPILSDALLAEAVRKGWITPPAITTAVPWSGPVTSVEQLLQELSEDRKDR